MSTARLIGAAVAIASMAMAATAIATSKLRIATGIIPIYLRDPLLTAMTFATLQDLSGGRMIAGFGTSTPAIVTGSRPPPAFCSIGTRRRSSDPRPRSWHRSTSPRDSII